ncbi:hypothetical protein HMPREF9057_00812 [Actinomyces sp. oral taxon 171 str. F0337]|nr:hypothetical protein HMPREF9057_00812 [Actinomyces sp. oral taxon 171 str. F0337]
MVDEPVHEGVAVSSLVQCGLHFGVCGHHDVDGSWLFEEAGLGDAQGISDGGDVLEPRYPHHNYR